MMQYISDNLLTKMGYKDAGFCDNVKLLMDQN